MDSLNGWIQKVTGGSKISVPEKKIERTEKSETKAPKPVQKKTGRNPNALKDAVKQINKRNSNPSVKKPSSKPGEKRSFQSAQNKASEKKKRK